LNQSEFSDVLRLYGTAGFNFLDATMEYFYEDVDGQLIYRPTIRDVVHPDQTFYLGFNIDRENRKVRFIYVADYTYEYNPENPD